MNSLGSEPGPRIQSIDIVRGVVMVLMAIDHVRVYSGIPAGGSTGGIFFTRWITHFCMPVFMFAAGLGMFLFEHSHTKRQLSRFLWTRGLWFILLELTVMQPAYNFSFSSRFMLFLLILWIFGICMIAMAGLIHLPVRWLAALSVAVILFHNCLDGIDSSRFGSAAWVWVLLHQPGLVRFAGRTFRVPYTFIPWIAVMAAGYCFGRIFLLEPAVRQRILLKVGLALTIAFVVILSVNRYGDPAPWAQQKSFLFDVLSFLNCTKYPASFDFLLMTLGPALLVLAYRGQRNFKISSPFIVFGRVPMFYFVLHFYLINTLAVLAAWLRYGSAAAKFTFTPVPSMGGSQQLFPADFGYSLWVVYAVWLVVVVSLYPICRWFARVKSTRRDWWLSYL